MDSTWTRRRPESWPDGCSCGWHDPSMGMFSSKRPRCDTAAASDGGAFDPLGPSSMPHENWMGRHDAYQRQGRSDDEIRSVTRVLFVAAEEEAPRLTRDDDGLPLLPLVDSGDRLSVWSPFKGGSLLNPKGTGLRRFGLISTYARGGTHYVAAYRAADLRKGKPVELRREPHNPHDRNAVALHPPGSREPFGYAQKGRAPVIARRMDAGEHLAGVSLRGPGPRSAEDSALLLIGSALDLAAALR